MDLLLSAAVMWVLVWVFARDATRTSLVKVSVVILAVLFVTAAASRVGSLAAEVSVSLVAMPIALAVALIYWCKVKRTSAIVIGVLYSISSVALAYVLAGYYGAAA
jgi:hypothetical protein